MYGYPASALEPIIGTTLLFDGIGITAIVEALRNEGVSDVCIDFTVHLTCLTRYPCNSETSLPLLLCENSCRLFDQVKAAGLCQDLEDTLIGLSMRSSELSMAIGFLTDFNCRESDFPEYDPNICTNLFSPEAESKSKKK